MTNKEFYTKHLEKLNQRKETLMASLIKEEDANKRASIGDTLKTLGEEIREAEEMLSTIDEPANEGNGEGGAEGNGEGRGLIPLATMKTRTGAPATEVDPYDTPEYRTAFMNFACRGEVIPANLRATTLTTDVSAAIPTTYLNEIVKELKSYGNIYAAVRKLNVQGGVEIPISDIKPTAVWIGDTASDAQKLSANESVSFKYFGLECKIAQSLLVSVTTLEAFQNLFVELATEAIAKALDISIISGSGTNQPLGVINDKRVPSGNVVTLTEEEFTSWSGWKKKVFGKMKKAYRKGNFYMAQGTFDGYIDGMVDQNGQPIGRVNYGIDGEEKYRFGGKNVETVEDDVIKAYDDASAGDVVAVFLNPSDYGFNSNLEMKTVKWIDNDTNEVKTKVVLIGDGKLIDPNGVVIVKKGAASA